MLRSILAAVKAGTDPNLDITPAAQAYLQAELARNKAGGEGGGNDYGLGGNDYEDLRTALLSARAMHTGELDCSPAPRRNTHAQQLIA